MLAHPLHSLTIEQTMSGKNVARGIPGHFLALSALYAILLRQLLEPALNNTHCECGTTALFCAYVVRVCL